VDLAGEGELRLDGRAKRGRARAWFDHEFGSDQLAADVVGWDWYSLRLDDGAALMLYRLRLASGGDSPFSSGTFVAPDGAVRHLKADEVRTGTLARFRSPRSGADYPVARRLEIPALALRLDVRPAVLDQELTTDRTTRVTYYEGFVTATGERAGKPVAAEGYQELVGYAGGAARF
jgi:predicted secreted hydrolase